MAAAKKPGAKKPRKRKPAQRAADTEAVIADIVESEGREGPKTEGRFEQTMRDLDIWRGYLRGMQPESLAATYQLQPRTVREIVKEMGREAQRISAEDPADIVQEYVWRVEAAVDELAVIAVKEKGNARINAIKVRLEAMRHKMEVLQAVGILPEDLGMMGQRLELRAMFGAVVDVIVAELPQDQAEKILVLIRDRWEPTGMDREEHPALTQGEG